MRYAPFALLGLGVALAGCVTTGPARVAGSAERPGIVVNASATIVRDVIIDSARERGSAFTLSGDAVVLQRPLDRSSDQVMAACGPHRPGRAVRVLLRAQGVGAAQTSLSEERFIVDGGQLCPLPLSAEDMAQSRAALNRTKATAEAVQARVRMASR